MAVRSALHQAGAAALTKLLQFPSPTADRRNIPCGCGYQARYRQLRSQPVLTVVGESEVSRPYYLCPHCHAGQFPADVELDIENTEFSPGVRRMQAVVGQEAPFGHGRQQMKLLAGLEVTPKAVERTAEAIGADIAEGEQCEIRQAVQLDLPVIVGEPIPILYVQMDGTAVPVVRRRGGRARPTASRPIRGKSNWDAFSRRPDGTKRALRFPIPIPLPTPGPSRPPKSLESVFTSKPGSAAGDGRKRKSSGAMGPNGSGIWPNNTSPARFKLSIYITRASTCGSWLASCFPTTK